MPHHEVMAMKGHCSMVMITVVHDVVSQCCVYQHVELYCHGRETFPGKLMKHSVYFVGKYFTFFCWDVVQNEN